MIKIIAMQPEDWPEVRIIYQEGMDDGNATFEIAAPSWDAWNRGHLPHSRLVASLDGQIAGWAALSPVSSRRVYAGVAEVSIYVAAAARDQGMGQALLTALVDSSEQNGIWTLQAGIFPENRASIALHEGCGFRLVGIRERPGQLNGVWRDVALLERRSPLVGAA